MFRKISFILLFVISIGSAQWQNGFVLQGKICTMSEDSPVVIENGQVLVYDQKIVRILHPGDPLPAEFQDAVIINTEGVIYPGLIDLHNHPAYNMLPVWNVPKKYRKNSQWRSSKAYKESISREYHYLWDSLKLNTRIALYAEVKAMSGGTTTLQGLSQKRGGVFYRYLVRNADLDNFGTDRVGTSVRRLRAGSTEFLRVKDKLNDQWDCFFYHVAEGTDPSMIQEFEDLKAMGSRMAKIAGIHCTALTDADFEYMGQHGMALVWSPLSNLLLYGATTDVAAAKRHHVLMSIGPDWSPSGSKNVLWELKVAYLWNRDALNGLFSPKELVQMVTVNPAKMLNWQDKVGQIREGLYADLIVTSNLKANPYLNLIHCTEKDIRLVVINGEPYYGDKIFLKRLKKIGRKHDFETVTKKLPQVKVVDITRENLYDQSWKSVVWTLKHYMESDNFPNGPEPPDEIYTALDPDFFEGIWTVPHNPLSVVDLAAFVYPIGKTTQTTRLLKKPWGKLLYKIPEGAKVIIVKPASGRRKNWHEVLVKTDQAIVLHGVVRKELIAIEP